MHEIAERIGKLEALDAPAQGIADPVSRRLGRGRFGAPAGESHWRIRTKVTANPHFVRGLESRYPSFGGSWVRIPPPPPFPETASSGFWAARLV